MTDEDIPTTGGTWVQTEREAHEAWSHLIAKAPVAARIMHLLTARVGDNNSVVISHKTLASLLQIKSVTTVKKGLAILKDDRWIGIRQVGDRGTVNAYILNSNVAWTGPRDGIRYSQFSATVIISDVEQPDREKLSEQASLRRLPTTKLNERQLPTGPGLPPVSQPSFDGWEPDLPSIPDNEN